MGMRLGKLDEVEVSDMPFSTNYLLGLIILSIGVLSLIVSFLVTDRKRYVIAVTLSGLIMAIGAFQYLNQSIRQWQMSRRLSRLRSQQQINLESLRQNLPPNRTAPAAAPAGSNRQTDTQRAPASAPRSR
jgi:hypothetical protein